MKYLFVVLWLASLSVYANELKSEQSKQIAEQLIRTINQKVAEITALELAAGVPIKDISINLSQHKRFDTGRFGAVLDANQPGLIVSVTPRSQASELGIQSGDIIKTINGTSFVESAQSAFRNLQYLPNDSKVSVIVERLGKELTLSALLKAKYIPQWQLDSAEWLGNDTGLNASHVPYWHDDTNAPIFSSALEQRVAEVVGTKACGRVILVNSLSISPPKYSGLKTTTVIKEIDGMPWLQDKSRVRVSVGAHQLRIGNKYDLPKEFRDFTINVLPNTNYYVAYVRNKQWFDDKGNELSLGKYTGPVIWKTAEQACQK
ncbi:PDZ domain-containing protein [Thalassotalea sp. M1531]|uniref:PDZ domain-containing protein n=1 Tax=Thalassotalea algicola TaxID=2716224 RepID=A0A7Y0LCG2_9GAMM|nr:PDZ domain-containing protein [Thalassotalea algicola]NMP31886.1 PDZ domain-containing protein [Thalassotalea algicola]